MRCVVLVFSCAVFCFLLWWVECGARGPCFLLWGLSDAFRGGFVWFCCFFFPFVRLGASVEVFGEEFIFVVAQVGCVDDLVEVVCSLLLLFKWFCGCAIVSKVVSGAVGRVDHESCFE